MTVTEIVQVVINGVTDTANYDAQDRMTLYGNAAYVYTKKGDLQYKIEGTDTTGYYYDNMGNLITVNLPNGDVIEYVIDAQNRRTGKKLNGTLVKGWLYSGDLTPVAEIDGAGNITARYVYASKVNVPDYIIKDSVTYRLITDHLGSVRLVINSANGDIAQKIDYDEFGNITNVLNENEFFDFTYAGGLYDNQTKLVRFGARDYDSYTGRWTAKDPIGFEGGDYNLYGYVVNDPVNMVDANGKIGTTQMILQGFAYVSTAYSIYEGIESMAKGDYLSGTLNLAMSLPILAQVKSGLNVFKFAAKFGINTYKSIKAATKGKGLLVQVHHLIEKRFGSLLGMNADEMMSIVLTKAEHAIFTKKWRELIGYALDNKAITTATAAVDDVYSAAREIYKDYPIILRALGL